MNPHEAKRLCDESYHKSQARRRAKETRREFSVIVGAVVLITLALAIAATLKGWAIW